MGLTVFISLGEMSLKEKKDQEKILKAQLRQKDGERKEELINIMINYPEIWNKASPDFRDRQLQGVKWEEIAKLMKMSVKDVQKMWKYLKDQFRSNFHAVSKKKSGQEYVEDEDIQLVKWPYFNQLMFLKDVVSRRETICNIEYNDGDNNGEAADHILNAMAKGYLPDEIIDDNAEHEEPSPESDLPEEIMPTRSNSPIARASTSKAQQNPPMRSSSPITRASTTKPKSNKRKLVDNPTGEGTCQDIRGEIANIDNLLAASMAHKCERQIETRSQRFCKYLADLLTKVPEESQFDCEMELMGVVRSYMKKNS